MKQEDDLITWCIKGHCVSCSSHRYDLTKSTYLRRDIFWLTFEGTVHHHGIEDVNCLLATQQIRKQRKGGIFSLLFSAYSWTPIHEWYLPHSGIVFSPQLHFPKHILTDVPEVCLLVNSSSHDDSEDWPSQASHFCLMEIYFQVMLLLDVVPTMKK